jgi:hypothetical protein
VGGILWAVVGIEAGGVGVAAGIACAPLLVPVACRPDPRDVAFAVVTAVLLASAGALGALVGTGVHARTR